MNQNVYSTVDQLICAAERVFNQFQPSVTQPFKLNTIAQKAVVDNYSSKYPQYNTAEQSAWAQRDELSKGHPILVGYKTSPAVIERVTSPATMFEINRVKKEYDFRNKDCLEFAKNITPQNCFSFDITSSPDQVTISSFGSIAGNNPFDNLQWQPEVFNISDLDDINLDLALYYARNNTSSQLPGTHDGQRLISDSSARIEDLMSVMQSCAMLNAVKDMKEAGLGEQEILTNPITRSLKNVMEFLPEKPGFIDSTKSYFNAAHYHVSPAQIL